MASTSNQLLETYAPKETFIMILCVLNRYLCSIFTWGDKFASVDLNFDFFCNSMVCFLDAY